MNDITAWLEILTHEITHIKQIGKYRFLCFGLLPYLVAHMYHYIKAKSHDDSKLEKEPLAKQRTFRQINGYLNKTIEPYALAKLFCDTKLTEKEKVHLINKYFNLYKEEFNLSY